MAEPKLYILSTKTARIKKEGTMQAIEMKAQVTNNHEIIISLPEHIRNKTVKVIIMYDKEPEKNSERQFGQFKEPFFIADDFDNELPDSFWLGE